MIKLESDTLHFSFPATHEALKALVDDHVRTVLPQILREDRQAMLPTLHALRGYQTTGAENRRKADDAILKASAETIGELMARICQEAAHLHNRHGALASISFQRTLRIPDDGNVHFLPAGLGKFPLRHVDDYQDALPESWVNRGGVMMPMYQSEALWIHFNSSYPCAVKIGSGKINAVTGEAWSAGLQSTPQDYVVIPGQPWLDGFAVAKGVIRQFVAMPLGDGYSVEEQVSGRAEVGGIQIQVIPMKAQAYFEKSVVGRLPKHLSDLVHYLVQPFLARETYDLCCCHSADMGLGAGGQMRQEIYEDPHPFQDWDTEAAPARCFVHLCNALQWREITGTNPPHPPLSAKEYQRHRIPWFDYYRDDLAALDGSKVLNGVKSVAQIAKEKGGTPLSGNGPVKPELIVQFGNARRPDEVREWAEP